MKSSAVGTTPTFSLSPVNQTTTNGKTTILHQLIQTTIMKKVIAVHLLNDYSGSPLILSTVLRGMRENDIPVDLLTSKATKGFLSDLDVNYRLINYKWYPNRWVRLLAFLVFQVSLFFRVLNYRKEDVLIYVNTLLPFGAALAGWLMGKQVVYHCHETSLKPLALKRFLKWVASVTATKVIYVSQFLAEAEHIPNVETTVVPNALSTHFLKAAEPYLNKDGHQEFTVLMLCSLKDYKGVREFLKIADRLPDIRFELVLNSDETSIATYFGDEVMPGNLSIYPTQTNVHPFYSRASIVLNLSRPDEWVETFGMTLLEAMHYGAPCIGPPVGGPSELIRDGENGYQISAYQWEDIVTKIEHLFHNQELYARISATARKFSTEYSSERMLGSILECMQFTYSYDYSA